MKTIVRNNNYTNLRTTISLTLLTAICIECGGRSKPYGSINEIHIAPPGTESKMEKLASDIDSLENEIRIKQELKGTSPSLEEANLQKSSILDETLTWLRQHEKYRIMAFKKFPWFSPLNDSYRESHIVFVTDDNGVHGCLKTSVEQNVSNNSIQAENDLVCHRMPEGYGHIDSIEAKVKNDGSLIISFCAETGVRENSKETDNFCYRWQPDKLALRKYSIRSTPLDRHKDWIQNWSQPPTSNEWWPYKADAKNRRYTSQNYTLSLSPEIVMSAVAELPMNSISWVSSSTEPTQEEILISLSDENNQERLIAKVGSGWSVLPWDKKNGILKAWAEDAKSMTGLSKSIWLFYEWYDTGSEGGSGGLIAVLYVLSENGYRNAGNLQLGAYKWEQSSSTQNRRETIVRRRFNSFSVVDDKCIQMRVEARWSAKYPNSGNRRPVTDIKWTNYDFERNSIVAKTPQKGDTKLWHWTGKEFLPGCANSEHSKDKEPLTGLSQGGL